MATCPVCNSQVSADARVCPACHADLTMTRVMPRLSGSFCVSCGALVPDGSDACPKCGRPVALKTAASRVAQRVPSIEEDEAQTSAESTNVMPRIESALPAEPDPEAEALYGREHLPKTRTFMVAALASLVIVGGGVLLITHPWNPNQWDTRATTAADVSTAGYPGEVEKLSGQDKGVVATSVLSADEQTYADLMDAYTQLGQYSKLADELESELDEYGLSGTADERAQAAEDAEQLSLDISNLASEISSIEVSTTGSYTTERSNLSTLASWLRNRIEALEKSWNISANSTDLASDEDAILAPMVGNRTSDGPDAYVNLFAANYEDWMPQEK